MGPITDFFSSIAKVSGALLGGYAAVLLINKLHDLSFERKVEAEVKRRMETAAKGAE